MIDNSRVVRLVLSVLVLIALVFVACQRQGQAPPADNAGIGITLQHIPGEETVVVGLTGADGAPVTDATVALEGNMNHAGMIPVLADAVADDADGNADGRYHLPFSFTMLGDWIITVTVTQAEGSSFSRNLDVRVSEEGIEGEAVLPADSAAPIPAADEAHAHEEGESNTQEHVTAQQIDHEEATGKDAATIHVHDPAARPAPLAGGTGAVYFLLHNGSDVPVRWIGGESPAAAAVEIHTTINDNGVMRMRQVTDVELGPDESLHLAPGGMHLMLVDLVAPLVEGDTVEVTLHFEGANDLTVAVPVVAMDELPAEGEAAHDHESP